MVHFATFGSTHRLGFKILKGDPKINIDSARQPRMGPTLYRDPSGKRDTIPRLGGMSFLAREAERDTIPRHGGMSFLAQETGFPGLGDLPAGPGGRSGDRTGGILGGEKGGGRSGEPVRGAGPGAGPDLPQTMEAGFGFVLGKVELTMQAGTKPWTGAPGILDPPPI